MLMLNKKITDNYAFRIYRDAFKQYIHDNRLLSAEAVEELEKIENFFFSYNYTIDEVKNLEGLLKQGEYVVLFGINTFNNSIGVYIYGKIDIQKINELKERISTILANEKYQHYTYNVLRLYDKRSVMAVEMHLYSERSTPLLLQKIAERLKETEYIWKVFREELSPMALLEAIKTDKVIVEVQTAVSEPTSGELKVYISIFGPSVLMPKVQRKINQMMLDFLLIPEKNIITYVPNSTLSYCRNENCYSNNLTTF